MAIIFTGTVSGGFPALSDDNTYITVADAIVSNDGNAFSFGTTSNNEYTIFGSVIADLDGIVSTSDSASGHSVVVNEGGSVLGGSDGMELRGSTHKVLNNGSIIGLGDGGIQIVGVNAIATNNSFVFGQLEGIGVGAGGTVFNNGTVQSNQNGIVAKDGGGQVISNGTVAGAGTGVRANGSATVENSGTITGSFNAVSMLSDPDQTSALLNSGTITVLSQASGNSAVFAGEGNDTVKNTGLIQGKVSLGEGDDVYDGRNGTVTDSVQGSSGADKLLGGDEENALNGGGGQDTLKGRDGEDDLSGGDGGDLLHGGNGDDTLAGGGGSDTISGGQGDDNVKGGRGNDDLNGGSGDDTLSGADGQDVLKGGKGNDVFAFSSVSHSADGSDRDVITDFSTGQDLIDLSLIANFKFVGSNAFSGTQPEVRATVNGSGDTILRIDADGDGTSDSRIELRDMDDPLDAGDFIF